MRQGTEDSVTNEECASWLRWIRDRRESSVVFDEQGNVSLPLGEQTNE